uniref:SEC7 domain-containing protein n=1 Tax=Amphora coffeiformis TaxID=265554 RepID=A0A7S3P3I7_9STRA
MASNPADGESSETQPPDTSQQAPEEPPTTESGTDVVPAIDSKGSVEESNQSSGMREEEMTPVVSNKRKVNKDPTTRAQLAYLSLPATEEETTASISSGGDKLLGKLNESKEMNGTATSEERDSPGQKPPPRTAPSGKTAARESQVLEEAFAASETPHSKAKKDPRQTVHPETPIPNTDVALRLLRKFSRKTRPFIAAQYGGSRRASFFSYMFGSKVTDTTYVPYQHLVSTLYADGFPAEEDTETEEDEAAAVVDGTFGMPGDGMERARKAVASYVNVLAQWCHETALQSGRPPKEQQMLQDLVVLAMDTASALVAHGCLDDVLIAVSALPTQPPNLTSTRSESGADEDWKVAGDEDAAVMPAVYLLTQAVLAADFATEKTELVAMKFLLAAGCRISPGSQQAMLRGSYLLQTIRLLYHIFLTTESRANKTTARAALQQLITSVFCRMAQLDMEAVGQQGFDGISPANTATKDGFPSNHHRDAFLVLRSICKLSMRTLPDEKNTQHNHFGLQTSGSHDTWDGGKSAVLSSNSGREGSATPTGSGSKESAQLVYTSAIHPALESKILALDLILYVLLNTDFSEGFIQRSGPQFHAAIRQYLCVSLLKNCTSSDTHVVNLSLRIFVPLMRNFRTILKSEIEAFVTNVFFVILDSKNSPSEHKGIVVRTFEEICSDPSTLAEIFLNYDCDLSAVDLFHRIVNTLSRVARAGLQEPKTSSYFGGPSSSRMEKLRMENRTLRLDAMKALRQVLASLHASIVEPMRKVGSSDSVGEDVVRSASIDEKSVESLEDTNGTAENGTRNLVEAYGSKKKRRAEESEAILRFNQKPAKGIQYAAKCGHIDGEDPVDVARFLLKNKDVLEKTQIGEYLGREPDYQGGFSLKVLHAYVRLMDFTELMFDEAIRFFLSGFRLPGEAQKIDRIMEKFAERFTEQNPDVFPSADVAFILAFSIIMLNTDLHNPAIKEERRMTKDGFLRNNRGICDGQDLPAEFLSSIFDRIKKTPISLKEDDDARERVGDGKGSGPAGLPAALSPTSFFGSHYEEMDRERESNFKKERDHIVRTTESLLKRRRHGSESNKSPAKEKRGSKSVKPPSRFVRTEDSGLRDEYVAPMFEVTWGPALASFSTAMESANGTVGALLAIASDEELEVAAENAAETIEVCLTGFRFAICTAGLCGNDTARDAYMLGLSRFSQLGTGVLLEPRHVRCIQTMLGLAREDGELLGSSWQHVFRSLSEINRFHQLFHLMARNDRAAASAADRRRRKYQEKEAKREARERRKSAIEEGESIGDISESEYMSDDLDSLAESEVFSDDDDFEIVDDMDAKAIDEVNARIIYEGVSEAAIEAIYERSSSLSAVGVKEFVDQLCFVSRIEISVRGSPSKNDLTHVTYRQQHALLSAGEQFHHSQPNIYNLQKLVEVAHYNMDSRPRMIFADLWASIANHLTYTALHSNPALAMYAVDSFRQLSIQFLQRDELEVFEFQKRFLKPLETVMVRSDQPSTKELLLNCIHRIIQVFDTGSEEQKQQKGGLRSGWAPILAILGQGGRDVNHEIAAMSMKILSTEIDRCLKDKFERHVLLNEHFVETTEAILAVASAPHAPIASKAIQMCGALSDFLGDPDVERPQVKRKFMLGAHAPPSQDPSMRDLELWWPILLGLSRCSGDGRIELRHQSLNTLFQIVNQHFFPLSRPNEPSPDDYVQMLQLIFRGIFTPMLENAESEGDEPRIPGLPKDFERIINKPEEQVENADEAAVDVACTGWLETTFDVFMDACIALCKRSIDVFQNSVLVEEIFALFNSCLLSDPGSLAVAGLRRLEQFITSDLDESVVTEDMWATTCHLLRRCLQVRGLPSKPNAARAPNGQGESKSEEDEYLASVREFIIEDRLLGERRYVGSNAILVIGTLLSTERYAMAMGFRWKLFLISGLGRGIQEWEHAARLIQQHGNKKGEKIEFPPPDFRETALYGRKWMNHFLLNLASMKEVVQAPADADAKTNRHTAAQKLVVDETQGLLTRFLDAERTASQYRHEDADEKLHARLVALVLELLKGYINMNSDHLKDMTWISPVLLSSCIQSKNENVRNSVQKLVQLTSPASSNNLPDTASSSKTQSQPFGPASPNVETNEGIEEQSEATKEPPVDPAVDGEGDTQAGQPSPTSAVDSEEPTPTPA